jgi:beta-phosphoglucomutase
MIKAVIFDLDGVIVSTDDLHYKSWKHMTEREGIFFNEKINDRLRGVSRMASLEIILEKSTKTYSEQEKKELTEYKNNYYKELLQSLTKENILPGVMTVLDTLKQKKIKVAIGSSSRNAKFILKQIGLFDYFDAISDGTNIKHSKPAPDVFLIAAEKLNIDPTACLVVEDAISGVEAAANAHMMSFGVGDASTSKRATYKSKNILDLLNHI